MSKISKEDCLELQKEFSKYCETAEQNQFPLLMFLDMNIHQTINNFEKISQVELRSMFRTIYRLIGKDYSKYEDELI